MESAVSLDRSGPVWVASFPGLGQVDVHPDGSFEIRVDRSGSGSDAVDRRRDALHHGWAVPLSHVRRGRLLMAGSAVVDTDGRCLALHGPPGRVEAVLAVLVSCGWRVLATGFVAVDPSGDALVAHPGVGPVLVRVATAETLGVGYGGVRADSDVVEVDLDPVERPLPVDGIVDVVDARGTIEPFRVLTGHDRFQACTKLLFGVEPGAVSDPHDLMARATRLARVAHARLAVDRSERFDPAELVVWWRR